MTEIVCSCDAAAYLQIFYNINADIDTSVGTSIEAGGNITINAKENITTGKL